MSMVSGIQGQLLDVTVVGCSRLKDTEWISRQDPYVCLEYATTKFRTRTCTDGGKHPTFQEKTVIPLIEGLREIIVTVWNSNTLTFDGFIGSGRVQLQKVLSQGYDDSSWTIQSKSGKFAGEVKLIMHFANAQKPQKTASSYAPSPYMTAGAPPPPYAPPPAAYAPPKSVAAPPAYHAYPPPAGYPPPDPALYNPASSMYPPPPMQHHAYPPQPYQPPTYPPQPYPPPPQAQPYYPPGHYPGVYPPPPY